MEKSFLIAGFGGQGVMLIGKMLGHSAAYGGKNATFYPSYGPEQRGGTANCTVVLADEEVGSPVVQQADIVAVMNEPSLAKFADRVKTNGTLIVNKSLVAPREIRSDIKVVWLPTNEIAASIGSEKAANMVMLGCCVAESQVLDIEMAVSAVSDRMKKDSEILAKNIDALRKGAAFSA
ncbi:MAG: 2-oxoacid:acceptor oxidoreductase family protein [Negativicutes bacterium]|nr:2-oxoacid:acceptor oxidoreductase family protein [Negativicutes bacterium]